MPAGDITPAMSPIVIAKDKLEDKLKAMNMLWGLKGRDNKLIINARSESVLEKNMFRDSILNRRCIIPAAGFYEWNRDKTRYTFMRDDKMPMYFAALYDMSDNRDSFVILTTSADEIMAPVHDRMPVMIEKGKVRDYLTDPDAAIEMLGRKMPGLTRQTDYEQMSLF